MDGRDLLIGGLGTDTLRGASGEDILIGGTTSHDGSDAVLTSILATWNVVSGIDQRMALLSQPAASYRLIEGDTVQDDGLADVLVGGAAADWFFANAGDWIYAGDPDDRVV
jgi:Ca2+-binding RTX toxin-like protein